MDDNHREAVSRRIRALLNKTVENGATEEETISAAEKARALMDQYHLSMTDIEFKAEPVADVSFDRRLKSKTAPADYCTKGIEKYCGVRMWRTHTGSSIKIRVLGLKGDAEMAQWLYEMIEGAVWAQANVYLRTELKSLDLTPKQKRDACWSFELGMAQRVNDRLIAMAQALEPVAKTASGSALVVVRNAVVDEAFAKLNLRFTGRVSGMSNRDFAAYGSGHAAGDRVNLNRPVGSANTTRLH
jgi:hypothetical protein